MKTKKDLKIFAPIVVVLLIIAAFTDLQISQAIYNSNSMFGGLFEAIGEFPAMYIAAFCAMSVAVIQKKWNNGKLNLKSIGGFVLAILLGLMAGILPIGYFGISKAFGIVLGVVFIVANYFMVNAIAKSHDKELYKAATLGLWLFLFVILAFNLVKFVWGRERYRHMVQIGDFSGFSMWFLPQGLAAGNEFMSFPSGHSANSAIIMWITLLPTFIPVLEKKETLLKIVSCVWIACVMLSRVIMGAHFLSDVTMGMTISLVLFYVLYQRKYK